MIQGVSAGDIGLLCEREKGRGWGLGSGLDSFHMESTLLGRGRESCLLSLGIS